MSLFYMKIANGNIMMGIETENILRDLRDALIAAIGTETDDTLMETFDECCRQVLDEYSEMRFMADPERSIGKCHGSSGTETELEFFT